MLPSHHQEDSFSDDAPKTSELPSNLLLKKFTPSRWISSITVLWGIVATLTGVTQNYAGLIACRILLGLVEGGLFPGLAVYLTLFYTKRELALRIGYLFVSAALAGACGGLLAYGIGHLDGRAGLKGWRWYIPPSRSTSYPYFKTEPPNRIMIIEGLPTFFLGVASWWLLADSPEKAYYLTPPEKALMVVRRNRQLGQTASAQEMHKEDVLLGLKDWKIYMFCAGQFGADTMLYGYSTFLPTIIQSIGHWSTAQVQALTIPCYVVGAASYLVCARLSDSQQLRGVYCVVFGGISVIGYGILISESGPGVHYFGCFVVAMGLYVVAGLPLAWLPNNQPRYGKRTTATGLQLTIGNCSGIMAPFVSFHLFFFCLGGCCFFPPITLSLLARNGRKKKHTPLGSIYIFFSSIIINALSLPPNINSSTKQETHPATSKATPSPSRSSASRPAYTASCGGISRRRTSGGRKARRTRRLRAWRRRRLRSWGIGIRGFGLRFDGGWLFFFLKVGGGCMSRIRGIS